MTTTNQLPSQRPEQPQLATPQAQAGDESDPVNFDHQRQLWEAYRLQQQRLHCPTCGDACDVIY